MLFRSKGQYVIACDSYAGAPAMQVADEFEVFSMLDGDALEDVYKRQQFVLYMIIYVVFGIFQGKVFQFRFQFV